MLLGSSWHLARTVTTCQASGGKRAARGGGGGRRQQQQPGSKQQHGGTAGGGGSAARLSAAAKAAAKRASAFALQRQQRAIGHAQQQQTALPPPPGPGLAGGAARRLGRSRSGGSEHEQLSSAGARDAAAAAPDLRPFVEVVTDHLRQSGSLSGSSSSGGGGSTSSSGRGRGAKRAAARALLEAHSAVFQAALDLELQTEWQEAEERLQAWPAARLASEGVALFGLAAAPDGGVARDVLLRFFVPGRPLPFHSFSQGDILLISRGDPLADSHEGVVVDSSSRWIRLALQPAAATAIAAASGGWSRARRDAGGRGGRGSDGSDGDGSGGGGARGVWRLDLFANTVSHERCSEGLRRFAATVLQQPGGPDAAAAAAAAGAVQLTQGEVQQAELLCRLLAGVVPAGTSLAAAASVAPPWAKHGRERLSAAKASVKALVEAGTLNASQGAAISAGLSRSLTLWQGPPGTGKTTTLLRFVQAALQVVWPGGGQVLAVAASNVAVDQLVAGLLSLGVAVVRLGQPVKVTPALRAVSLEVLAAATVPGQAAAKLRQQLVAAAAASHAAGGGGRGSRGGARGSRGGSSGRPRSGGSSGSGTGGGSSNQGKLWEQVLALEAAAAAEVLGAAQVVAATCVGAGDSLLAGRCFELAVLDEATQAPEPAALTAIAARAQALVMVGDPQQLPPTVRCPEAATLGLGYSLFERAQAMGLKPWLLDTQYRMHPALADFPSSRFYGGLLRSAPRPADRPAPPGLAWPNPEVPIMFLQVSGSEARTSASFSISRQREATASSSFEDDERGGSSSRRSSSASSSGSSGGGTSYSNAAEAAAVVACVRRLLAAGMGPEDVCVITPYSGQVRAVQRLLANDATGSISGRDAASGSSDRQQRPPASSTRRGQPPGTGVSDGAAAPPPEQPAVLEARSVDGFQGREKEVVVFSCVRCNRARRVGFLRDARRLNVALTRARRGLVVVGDAATLAADPTWAAWLRWARGLGLVVEGSRSGAAGAAQAGTGARPVEACGGGRE